MAGYIGHGPDGERAMLAALGVASFEDLLKGIPKSARLTEPTPIPPGETEEELRALFSEFARANYNPETTPSFLGAGLYDHILPAAIRHLTLRSEFYTAYTPYQAEVAQGTLATVFEFQTIMAELTGMDLANASMYDGASAAAEAALMAAAATNRKRLLICGGFHPHFIQVIHTYAGGPGLEVVEVAAPDGTADLDALGAALGPEVAAVLIQYPNFWGCVQDLRPVIDAAHNAGALAIVSVNLISLGLLESPGACGADLVTAEAQCFGNPPSFGGPLCGVLAARKELVRRMPGRLVAEARDADGHRGFVLTLQTREQHIRRDKATSNICTNNNLVALGVTLYFSLLGTKGIHEVASQCLQKAHYLESEVAHLKGVRRPFSAPFFHEFVLELPKPAAQVIDRMLLRDHVLAGFDLGRCHPHWENRLLVAVTEKRTWEELEHYIVALEHAL